MSLKSPTWFSFPLFFPYSFPLPPFPQDLGGINSSGIILYGGEGLPLSAQTTFFVVQLSLYIKWISILVEKERKRRPRDKDEGILDDLSDFFFAEFLLPKIIIPMGFKFLMLNMRKIGMMFILLCKPLPLMGYYYHCFFFFIIIHFFLKTGFQTEPFLLRWVLRIVRFMIFLSRLGLLHLHRLLNNYDSIMFIIYCLFKWNIIIVIIL